MQGQGRKRQGGWGWKGSKEPKRNKTSDALTRLQRQVALLKPEVKYFQGTISNSNITQAAGICISVSDVLQGITDANRVADDVRAISIRVRALFTDVTAVTLLRFLVVKDKETNGVSPTVAGNSVTSIFNSVNPRAAMQLSSNRKRFTILYDQSFTNTQAASGYYRAPFVDTGVIKLSGTTSYLGTAGATTDLGRNQYYVVILVDGADTADVNGGWEFCFTDA